MSRHEQQQPTRHLPSERHVDRFLHRRAIRWREMVLRRRSSLERMPVFVRQGEHIRLYPEEVESTDDMDLSKSIILGVSLEFQGLNHSGITT